MGTSEPVNADTAAWRKSSYCQGGACVLVASKGDEVAVADAKVHPGPVLRFAKADWNSFLSRIKQGVS